MPPIAIIGIFVIFFAYFNKFKLALNFTLFVLDEKKAPIAI